MRLVRRLALLAALCTLLALPPALAGASETCTTLVGGARPDRLASSPLSTSCAEAILSVSPNPATPGALVTLDGGQSVGGDVGNPLAGFDWDFGDGATTQTAASDPGAPRSRTPTRAAPTRRD